MWKSTGNARTVLRMVLKKRLYFTGYKYQLMYVYRTDDNRRDVILLQISSTLSIMPSILTLCTIHLGHISHVRPCSKRLLDQPHAFVEHSPYNPTLWYVFDLHIVEEKPLFPRQIIYDISPNTIFRNSLLCPQLAVTVLPFIMALPLRALTTSSVKNFTIAFRAAGLGRERAIAAITLTIPHSI